MPSIHVEEPIPPEESEEKPKPEPSAKEATSEETSTATAPEPSPSPQPTHPQAIAPKDNRKLFIAGSAVAVLLLLLLVANLINDRRELKQKVDQLSTQTQKPAQDQTQQEAEQLKKELSQYLELPADEVPTVATVVDANKVKGQSFFTNTQNGDKVLLFAKSGKAILYRPGTKKIVEVAPINLNQAPQAAPETTPKTNR